MVKFDTHKVKRFRGEEGIILQVTAPMEKATIIDAFLAKQYDGILSVTIEKPSKKRTLNANAYLWVLCDRIAKAIGTDKESVYKALVRRVGVFDYILVKDDARERFKANWEAKGLGWFTDETVTLKGDRISSQLMCYYGTSVYSRAEMSRIIEEAEDAARDVGADTMSRKDVKEMIEQWQ